MNAMQKFDFWLKGFAISALLLCTVTEAHGPAKHEHEHAGAMPKPAQDMGSSAAADAQGRLWLASKETTADGDYLMLQTSNDQGRNWSAPTPASHEHIVASGDERPRIAFGPKGQIYISYSRPLAKPYTSELRFIHSEDGGRHFSPAVTVHKNSDVITHGFGSMAVDGAGDIYITWIDKRDQQAARAAGGTYAGAAQYYAVSRDGGISFQGDYKIADNSCECCRSALALNAGGQPMLLWRHIFEPNIRDHALLALTPDGKLQAPQRASFDNWSIDACPHQGPALAYGPDGRRHQTWFTGADDNGGLYYAAQNRDGALGVPMRLGGDQASHADVAVQGTHVALVWKEFDGKITTIKGSNSYDGGDTWQAATLAETEGGSDQPRLVSTPHGILLVWRTRQNGIVTVAMPKGRA